MKHLPAWQRSAIKDKCDIVHIFATLDKVIEEKNKEIVRQSKRYITNYYKNNYYIYVLRNHITVVDEIIMLQKQF